MRSHTLGSMTSCLIYNKKKTKVYFVGLTTKVGSSLYIDFSIFLFDWEIFDRHFFKGSFAATKCHLRFLVDSFFFSCILSPSWAHLWKIPTVNYCKKIKHEIVSTNVHSGIGVFWGSRTKSKHFLMISDIRQKSWSNFCGKPTNQIFHFFTCKSDTSILHNREVFSRWKNLTLRLMSFQ